MAQLEKSGVLSPPWCGGGGSDILQFPDVRASLGEGVVKVVADGDEVESLALELHNALSAEKEYPQHHVIGLCSCLQSISGICQLGGRCTSRGKRICRRDPSTCRGRSGLERRYRRS